MYPMRVRSLDMCRGELPAVAASLISVCEAGGNDREKLELTLPLLLRIIYHNHP